MMPYELKRHFNQSFPATLNSTNSDLTILSLSSFNTLSREAGKVTRFAVQLVLPQEICVQLMQGG